MLDSLPLHEKLAKGGECWLPTSQEVTAMPDTMPSARQATCGAKGKGAL